MYDILYKRATIKLTRGVSKENVIYKKLVHVKEKTFGYSILHKYKIKYKNADYHVYKRDYIVKNRLKGKDLRLIKPIKTSNKLSNLIAVFDIETYKDENTYEHAYACGFYDGNEYRY